MKLARELNEDRPNCRFLVNAAPDLGQLETEPSDLVYASLVLQHMPSVEVVEAYVGELLRVLRPGGLAVFQASSQLSARAALQPRRRVYAVLRGLGLSHLVLLTRLNFVPTRLTSIAEEDVRRTVAEHGGAVELVEEHPKRSDGVRSLRYYVRV